jgi:serine/threonine protein kinase
MAGYPPFEDEDPIRIMRMHRYDQPIPLKEITDIGQPLSDFISRTLSKKPENRFRDDLEMKNVLMEIADSCTLTNPTSE